MKLLVLFSLLLLSACSSHMYFKASGHENDHGQRLRVYVKNPELEREYEILKRSKIFELSSDSSQKNKVTLAPLEASLFCGNPFILTGITLGLMPSSVPDVYQYRFTLQADGNETEYSYWLHVVTKYSIYETLKFWRPSDNQVLADALERAYQVK